MSSRKFLALGLATVFAVGACTSTSATPSPASQAPAPTAAPASTAPESAAPSESAAAASPSAEALAPDPAEAVIQGVEPNAEIGFWTFYLSPTFDNWIKDTITRFEATYPGVKVNWEDHQATFKDDLNNAFAAGNAPDVINLSVSEGWVSEYAGKGLLLPLDDKVPQAVKDSYFPGLWKEQLIDGVNYQFPWYQGLSVDLINKAIFDKAGVSVGGLPEDARRPARAVQDDLRQDRHRCATSASRSATSSPRWSTRATSRSSATTARSSRSTRRRRSRGSRCTSTWSRRAPWTTRS